jgi:predicted short-subunit dehydrogenase-like oxidoreductase (DUF2520 family)
VPPPYPPPRGGGIKGGGNGKFAVKFKIKNIVIIGSGNVAYHLLKAFSSKGINILQILGRNATSTENLSKTFGIPFITDPGKLNQDADLYILAVQDDQIREAATGLNLKNQLLVHTSGFTALDVLTESSTRTGVLWPLQTLTSNKAIDFKKVPFFIEGNNAEIENELAVFAGLVSDKVIMANTQIRQQIHLAAVIASNLTNNLYEISALILEKYGLPFSMLGPLITETAEKAIRDHPHKSQTGPASRMDMEVIGKHLEMLKDEPVIRDIYKLISENIIFHHTKTNEKL